MGYSWNCYTTTERTPMGVDLSRQAAVQLRDAVRNPGPVPSYHHQMMDKLSREWPVLHTALMQVVAEIEADL
ncbi:hypothetical protein KNU39_gp44 [Gordonia phage Mutzi]|uniref:Uncharacterized protein n=1 Tax=Gordonia phage Mutzi TaxID=2500789 RepID=A0A411AXP2_9CAUD|nr:hypothetical protein KNU39_gp44 [Gordonia phage Mutzi]QAX92859.1 hypothetical protein SEA_MUTZI_44 [Gordonia phage Mutzi]